MVIQGGSCPPSPPPQHSKDIIIEFSQKYCVFSNNKKGLYISVSHTAVYLKYNTIKILLQTIRVTIGILTNGYHYHYKKLHWETAGIKECLKEVKQFICWNTFVVRLEDVTFFHIIWTIVLYCEEITWVNLGHFYCGKIIKNLVF